MRPASVVSIVLVACAVGACRGQAAPAEEKPSAAITVRVATAESRPLARHIQVTGTLAADQQADVAAEAAGRVSSAPIERGSRVAAAATLIQLVATEAEAQAAEAAANTAQIEARLAMTEGRGYEPSRVPEVANAVALAAQAEADFERARMLKDRQLLAEATYEQSRTQAEAAHRQADVARNSADQQYQALLAARARLTLARKTLADTSVRAPFAGVVAERFVSAGDYVTRGMKVATLLRISPLRLEVTIPEQYVSEVAAGRALTLKVDAFRDRTFTGRIRYVSPAVRTDARALVVEAIVPNDEENLKPGMFATVSVEQASHTPGIVVPAAAIRGSGSAARLFVVRDGRVEERVVVIGSPTRDEVEIVDGLQAGDIVVISNVTSLADGAAVTVGR